MMNTACGPGDTSSNELDTYDCGEDLDAASADLLEEALLKILEDDNREDVVVDTAGSAVIQENTFGREDYPNQCWQRNDDPHRTERSLRRKLDDDSTAAATSSDASAHHSPETSTEISTLATDPFHQHDEDCQYYEDISSIDLAEDATTDFFSENREEGELPEHMKDRFLEQFQHRLDANTTLQEFEQSQFDVHGIAIQSSSEEDPDMIDKALGDLDVEIETLKATSERQCESYILAESKSRHFVSNRSFRLRFLRSTSFDASAAARKMMGFFDFKRELWGEEKLAKKITVSDFDEGAWATLKNGDKQVLPVRDHAGRAVLMNNLNYNYFTDDGTNVLRTVWFLAMTAAEDEETQRNGLVLIMYKVGEQKGIRPNRRVLFKGMSATRSMPIKLPAIHVCLGRQSLPFVSLIKFGLEYQSSHRVRVHEGSQTECLNALAGFGIPRFAVPIASNGDVTRKYHLDWLDKRMKQEKQEEAMVAALQSSNGAAGEALTSDASSSCRIGLPSSQDVLFGRGKRSQFHPGNLRLNIYLEDKLPIYEAAGRLQKKDIAMSIVTMIQASGARFLKPSQDGSFWQVVTDKDAQVKVMHDFRTIRNKKKATTSNDADNKTTGKKRAS